MDTQRNEWEREKRFDCKSYWPNDILKQENLLIQSIREINQRNKMESRQKRFTFIDCRHFEYQKQKKIEELLTNNRTSCVIRSIFT